MFGQRFGHLFWGFLPIQSDMHNLQYSFSQPSQLKGSIAT
jgi:hypothetical protein